MKQCEYCNRTYADELSYCPKCGTALKNIMPFRFCPYCGAKMEADDLFCGVCGKKLSETKSITTKNFSSSSSFDNTILTKEENDKSVVRGDFNLASYTVICVFLLIINAFVYNLWLANTCLLVIMTIGWNVAKSYYKEKRILFMLVTILVFVIALGGIGMFKNFGKAKVREKVKQQYGITITQDVNMKEI